jgi:hypothetical protein
VIWGQNDVDALLAKHEEFLMEKSENKNTCVIYLRNQKK